MKSAPPRRSAFLLSSCEFVSGHGSAVGISRAQRNPLNQGESIYLPRLAPVAAPEQLPCFHERLILVALLMWRQPDISLQSRRNFRRQDVPDIRRNHVSRQKINLPRRVWLVIVVRPRVADV